jgi:hypothetical protein
VECYPNPAEISADPDTGPAMRQLPNHSAQSRHRGMHHIILKAQRNRDPQYVGSLLSGLKNWKLNLLLFNDREVLRTITFRRIWPVVQKQPMK